MQNFDFRMMKEICLENWGKGLCGSGRCKCQEICDLLKDHILPKDFDIKIPQEEFLYKWDVEENDGYCYSEKGTAYDIIHATWKAIEYSTENIKSINIIRVED